MDVYDELMKLCGFEPDEAKEYKPILKEGLGKWLVTEDDVRFGVTERLPKCWSTNLEGMRKILGCWLKEFIRVVMPTPEETRICHVLYPQPGMLYLEPIKRADPTVQVGVPDMLATLVGSAYFGVGWKYVEAAEREGAAIEQITCSLNKARYGLHILGILPRAEASLAFHTFCEDAALADQLIYEWDGTNTWTPYRVRDIPFDGDPFDEENIKYFAASLKEGHRKAEEWLGIEIRDEHREEAMEILGRGFMEIMSPIWGQMKADPAPLNANDVIYATLPIASALDIGYEDFFKANDILQEEIAEMVAKGEGVVPKGTPRVAWRGVNPWGCPWLIPLCHELGLSADSPEAFLFGEFAIGNAMDAVGGEDDMYMLMARLLALISVVGTSVEFVYQSTSDHIKEYKMDGLISSCYRPCRAFAAHSLMLARMIEERMGIPCITPDVDIYIDRGDFPKERMRTILETFADVVKRSKAKREREGAAQ